MNDYHPEYTPLPDDYILGINLPGSCTDCGQAYDANIGCDPNPLFNQWGDDFEALGIDREDPDYSHCGDCRAHIGDYHHALCDMKFCRKHSMQTLAVIHGADGCDCLDQPPPTATPTGF